MKPNEIRAAFKLADKTMKSLADEIGVFPQAIQLVITGKRPTPRIRQAIAERIVKRPVSEIWPEDNAEQPKRLA